VDLKLVTTPRPASRSSTCKRNRHVYRAGAAELLIDLVSTGSYQLVVNLDKVRFLDSAGFGVLVGGLRRVRAHDGSLDLVCTQQRILKILKITGLTEVFGIYETVDQAIAATKGRR
jgi:anti-sigma B factor antagonist